MRLPGSVFALLDFSLSCDRPSPPSGKVCSSYKSNRPSSFSL